MIIIKFIDAKYVLIWYVWLVLWVSYSVELHLIEKIKLYPQLIFSCRINMAVDDHIVVFLWYSLCLSHIQPQAPYDFYHSYDFFARKAEWSGRSNFTSVLFSWSHQATSPVWLDTAVYLWFGWMIRRTPRVPRAMPVQALCRARTWIFNVFHILRDPCMTHKGAVRCPYGHTRELTLPDLAKILHGRGIRQKSHTGPAGAVHGLFKIAKPIRGP